VWGGGEETRSEEVTIMHNYSNKATRYTFRVMLNLAIGTNIDTFAQLLP